jgi:tetratricopeptide (TPR) repeat protein
MVATEREALAVLDRVALLLPDDARVQDQQGSALQLASGAEIVLGHADAALDLARRSVAIRERLVARDPDNANSGNSLSSAYACVAQSLRELGRSKEAEAFSLRALAINEAHVAKTPDSAAAQGHLGRVLDEVADTYVASGKRESALAALERSRAIFQRLADREPELTWRWLLASTIRKEAGTELALARVDRAVVDAAKANALAEAITPISDDEVLVLRAQTRGLLGEARVERGLRAEGRQSLLDALADFDLLWNRGRSRAEWFHGAPEAARALARVMVQSGEGTEARARLEAVLAPLEELEKAGRLTFDLRPVLAGVRGDLAGLAR